MCRESPMTCVLGAIFAFVMIILLSVSPARSQNNEQAITPEAGMLWTFSAWCMTEEAARQMSFRVASDGDVGYRFIMKSQICMDVRFYSSGINKVAAKLVEKVWVLNHKDGLVLEVWTATSMAGNIAWVWIHIPPVGEST